MATNNDSRHLDRLRRFYAENEALPSYAELGRLLGNSWYPRDDNHRWMPKQATVRLGGPKAAGQRLYVSGYCPEGQLEKGPLPLALLVDGKALPTVSIQPGTARFDFDFALPAEL